MTSMKQAGLLVVVAGVVIAAFLVLRPESKSSNEEKASTPPAVQQNQSAPSTTEATKSPEATAPAEAKVPLLEDGKTQTIKVRKGDEVHFQVKSAVPEEVHVHGYDLSKDLPAGELVDMKFKATLEGSFEIELEDSSTLLATLKVEPS